MDSLPPGPSSRAKTAAMQRTMLSWVQKSSKIVPKSLRLSVRERIAKKKKSRLDLRRETSPNVYKSNRTAESSLHCTQCCEEEEESDGPPALAAQYPTEADNSPIGGSPGYVLLKYLVPKNGGKLFTVKRRRQLTGNKVEGGIVRMLDREGKSEAVFIKEFSDYAEAAAEMRRQNTTPGEWDSPTAGDSYPAQQSLQASSLDRVLEELDQIKATLNVMSANQALILEHLLGPRNAGGSQGLNIGAEGLTRRLSGMPRLTTMLDTNSSGEASGAAREEEEDEVGDINAGEGSGDEGMATLQPMVKLEPTTLPELKSEPSEVDDTPPQMDLCA